jgi:hypothetical protein
LPSHTKPTAQAKLGNKYVFANAEEMVTKLKEIKRMKNAQGTTMHIRHWAISGSIE